MENIDEKISKVKEFRLIDDVFFEAVAKDPKVCEEILRTILENPQLHVIAVSVQASERNLLGRSVILDALCELGADGLCNIEIQRADNDNHLKRARLNASMITILESKARMRFDEAKDVIVVYITEFDFLNHNKVCYHIDKVIRETGTVIDDGLREIFVNTKVKDGSDISDLMTCFTQTEISNPKFRLLSERVNYLKYTEEGVSEMCEIMQHYEKIAAENARIQFVINNSKRYFARGVSKNELVNDISEDLGMSKEDALIFFNENIIGSK